MKVGIDDIVKPEQGTQITLSMDDLTDINTKSVASTNERMLDEADITTTYYDLYVLRFNSSGTYLGGEAVLKTNVTGTNGDQTLTVTITKALKSGEQIVVLANTGIDPASTAAGLSQLTIGTSTKANINAAFPMDDSKINQLSTDNGRSMPMSGSIGNWGIDPSIVKMYRSVAKIQVKIDPGIVLGGEGVTTFADEDIRWGMVFYARKGAIYSDTPEPSGAIELPTTNNFKTGVNFSDLAYRTIDNSASYDVKTFYLPEYQSSTLAMGSGISGGDTAFDANRACVIVWNQGGGNHLGYRIDLAKKQSDGSYKYLDIKRNCHYIITIKKVRSRGYQLITDAEANISDNLEYEIKVIGDDDYVVASNGNCAVSLEYDKLIAMESSPSDFKLKARAILGTGLTTLPTVNKISASSGITLTGPTTLNTSEQDITFTMAANTSETISFELGSIIKTVTVDMTQDAFDAHFNHCTFDGNYSSVKWKKNDGFTITLNGTTSMTISSPENVTPLNQSALGDPAVEPVFESKYGEGYLTTSVGRTKVVMTQIPPDYVGWFGGDPNQSGNTYYSKRLIAEGLTEGDVLQTQAQKVANHYRMNWGPGGYYGLTDKDHGKSNTTFLMGKTNYQDFRAAYTCYMKNDADGDGTVSSAEFAAAGWYLPALYQLMGLRVNYPNLVNRQPALLDVNFWSSTEPTDDAWRTTMAMSGYIFNLGWFSAYTKSRSAYILGVRCVREL